MIKRQRHWRPSASDYTLVPLPTSATNRVPQPGVAADHQFDRRRRAARTTPAFARFGVAHRATVPPGVSQVGFESNGASPNAG